MDESTFSPHIPVSPGLRLASLRMSLSLPFLMGSSILPWVSVAVGVLPLSLPGFVSSDWRRRETDDTTPGGAPACLPATPNYLSTDSFPDRTGEIGFCCGCLRRVTQAIYPENFSPCVYSLSCYKYCAHCTLPARQMRTREKEFLPRTCD